jgi:hypothetical protein
MQAAFLINTFLTYPTRGGLISPATGTLAPELAAVPRNPDR